LRPFRRNTALALLAAVAASMLLAPAALADLLTPESGGSPNADEIDSLYKIILVIAVVIFAIVLGALLYCLVRYRESRGHEPAQIHGNTRLEIGWTIGATVILIALGAITFAKLGDIQNPPESDAAGYKASKNVLVADSSRRLPPSGRSLNICVNGKQYVWRYTYASNCDNAPLDAVFSYEEMVVPVATTVTLDINAEDVAHSWWIPQLGGKFDAIPGYTNHTWFKVPEDRADTVFTGQCAELCGRNHANMTAQVRAVTVDQFERWLARQKADIKAANDAAAIQRKRFEGGEE
jgi:cytochrome c oxidase subunit 2